MKTVKWIPMAGSTNVRTGELVKKIYGSRPGARVKIDGGRVVTIPKHLIVEIVQA